MGGGSGCSPAGVASLVAHPDADAIFAGMVRLSSDLDLPAPADEGASKKEEEASAPASASPPSFARAADPGEDAALWLRRVDEILNRDSPRSPYGGAGSVERSGQPPFPIHHSPNDATGPKGSPRIALRRHSMEGDLSPFQARQLQRPLQSPLQMKMSPNGPPHQDMAAAPTSETQPTASPANNASGGRLRRRHSTEGPPPFARLHLPRCGHGGVPPPFARDSGGGVPTQSDAATTRGSMLAASQNGRPPPPQARQPMRQGSRADALGMAGPQRRPYRRHSVDAPVCPPCPFQRPLPGSHTSKQHPLHSRDPSSNQHPSKHSREQTAGQWTQLKLEPTKRRSEGPPKELLVPRRRIARGGAPGAPGSPSSMSNASSVSDGSSIGDVSSAMERRRTAGSPAMPVPVEPREPRPPDGPFASPAGSADGPSQPSRGAHGSKAGRKPPRRHSVDSSVSPFPEFKSSWTSGARPSPPPPVSKDASLPGGSRGGSSSGGAAPSGSSGALPRRPRFVAPRTPPAECGIGMGAAAGASSGSSASSSKGSSNNAAERKPPVDVAARADGARRAESKTPARRPRRRATADGAPANRSSLRRPDGFLEACGLSNGDDDAATGVDCNKWDAAMERYRRERRAAAAEEAKLPAEARPFGLASEATGPGAASHSGREREAPRRRRRGDRSDPAGPSGLVVERDARPGFFFGLPVVRDLRGCPSDSVSSMSSVDSYVRKCARRRERKRQDLKARLEGEASVVVEAPTDEEGSLFAASSFNSFRKGRHPFASGGIVDRLLALDEGTGTKAKRRPSAGTSRTEAESTASSLLGDVGAKERPVYIRTHNGNDGPVSDLDVSALSSSVRCAEIDEGIDQLCAGAIRERTAARPSRRRASVADLRELAPDPDLGAEWRGHARRQSGERRCDAPDATGEGMRVRKERNNCGRRASFDCRVSTFRGERPEEGAVLRRMFAEHTAFLEGVAGRYDGRGGGGAVHGCRVEI